MTVPVNPYIKRGMHLDTVVVEGIRGTGFHGVLPTEKDTGQLFLADVVVHLDTRVAGRSDDLSKTVDYSQIADLAAEVLAAAEPDLVEAVAERIALRVLELDNVVAVDVTVHKPQAPLAVEFSDVAVTIRRDLQHGDLWSDKRIGSAAGLADDPRLPEAVPEPKDTLDVRPVSPVAATLALGGNVGDTELTLARAIEDLGRVDGIEVAAVSPLVKTKPVDGPEQGDFLNAVVRIHTTIAPRPLMHVCQGIEMVHGREREVVNGPRTLDIDLIAYGELVAAAEDLVIPHPRAHERAFVLAPWAAMEPDGVLPSGAGVQPTPGGPVAQLAAAAPDASGLTAYANPWDPVAVLQARTSAPPSA